MKLPLYVFICLQNTSNLPSNMRSLSLSRVSFFCYVPQIQGTWAKAPAQAECLMELATVLEAWILFGLKMGQAIPAIDRLNFDFIELADDGEIA